MKMKAWKLHPWGMLQVLHTSGSMMSLGLEANHHDGRQAWQSHLSDKVSFERKVMPEISYLLYILYT